MIDLAQVLYARKKLTIECIGKDVNQTGIAGIGHSKHRKGEMQAPKVSTVATLFDLLTLNPSDFAVYESTVSGMIYCEIEGAQMAWDSDTLYINPDTVPLLHHRYKALPIALYELSSHGTNDELKEVFSSIIDEYKSTGSVNATKVFTFCDSFYYGNAKGQNEVEDGDLDMANISAAFRSGTFKNLDIFKDLQGTLGKSKYESTLEEKKPKKAKTTAKNGFLKDCMDGKYVIPYTWPERMQRYIVDVGFLKSFESTPEFEEIVKKISFRAAKILERMNAGLTGADAIGKDVLNIMLLGKPGTGKTTLAYALSAALQMPICTTVHNKHTDEDEYEGKTKIVDGHPEFVETDALIFHENGGIDVCEEINLADPSVTMGGLGQKLEYPFIVKRNGYQTKVRHPLNVVIATMNVGTNGSFPLNQALANRFKTPYILDDPTRKTFISILEKSSGKSKEVCEWVYNAYEAVKTYLRSPDVNEEELCQNLSIRTCLGCIENMEEGQEPRRAVVNSIVGAVAMVDVELARKLQKEKVDCLPNPTFEF